MLAALMIVLYCGVRIRGLLNLLAFIFVTTEWVEGLVVDRS